MSSQQAAHSPPSERCWLSGIRRSIKEGSTVVVWTGKDPVRAHGEFLEVVLWRRKESAACTDPTQPLQALGSLQRSSSSCENIEHQKQISRGSRLFFEGIWVSGAMRSAPQGHPTPVGRAWSS